MSSRSGTQVDFVRYVFETRTVEDLTMNKIWTMTKPAMLLFVVACEGDPEQDKPTDGLTPSDTVPAMTGETGDSPPEPTGDTATPPVDVWPLCDHVGRTEPITLLGADRLDAAGSSLDAADIDGDGLLDLAIGAPDDSRSRELAGSVTLVFGASL
jgi:hypothetical protein